MAPGLDAITVEVIHEGLIAIVREMRATIVRTAYSSIIYEGQDFSCVLVDKYGQLIAKAPADHPIHIFPVPWSVKAILERHQGLIHPGDVFLHNDPYTGGTHLNDVATIYPVFLGPALTAFAVVRAHWADIGGMTPGSISGQTSEIFQEGVRLPPMRVFERGRPNEAVMELIFANVRDERERRGDFAATLVSCRQAARKLEAMADRYGATVLTDCLQVFVDRAEARMRRQIETLPDGTYEYEAYVESTGHDTEPLGARVSLVVAGDELFADFEGSSPQSAGPTNVGPSMAPSALFTIAKSYLDPTEEVNHGAWKPLKVRAPEGTFLNARPPAACGGLAEARYAADSAVMGALASALPEGATGDNKGCANHVYIAGRRENGEIFIFYEYPAGGTGAFNGGDGNTVMRNFQEGDFTSIQPVEAVESEHPLRVERSGVRQDSAGAGRWRGGFGLSREIRVLAEDAVLSVLSDRNILGPHGVLGGMAGAGNRFTVVRDGREVEPSPVPGKVSGFPLRQGDVVVMMSSGGGGYGDPLERDPELVASDAEQGYLSSEAVAAQYGVALDGAEVAVEATTELRDSLRAARPHGMLARLDGSELSGQRRVVGLSKSLAARVDACDGQVVEIVNPRGAPLRGWTRIVADDEDRIYLGSRGLRILRAQLGDTFAVRLLDAPVRASAALEPA